MGIEKGRTITNIIIAGVAIFGILSLSGATTFDFAEAQTPFLILDSFEARSVDGLGNNIANPTWGNEGGILLRMSPVDYDDGISEPAGGDRLSAREISNIVFDQSDPIPSKKMVSDMTWAWAQFLTHDTNHSTDSSGEAFFIPVPTGDPQFDPFSEGGKVIPLIRSAHDGGNTLANPREQLTTPTAFIDASMVYGSDQARADALRTFEGGKLKISEGNNLPFNEDLLPNACMSADPTECFLTGDVRANEQTSLLTLHSLFVREHNRLAEKLGTGYPGLTDEQIYQISRKLVGAEIQIITYREFIPAILGSFSIPTSSYTGYDPSVNPGILTEFSTVAFRFQHSQISPNILKITDSGDVIKLSLTETSFKPENLTPDGGIDSILRGLPAQRAQEIDGKMIDGLRNILFGPPGSGGIDLAAADIQRGRDHGIADYNTVRTAFGLGVVTSFSEITSNPNLANALEDAFSTVDNIDAFVGVLAEDHLPGAVVGETLEAMLIKQFTNLRDGDRFWLQNDPFFKENEKFQVFVKKMTLSEVIKANTNSDDVQVNIFKCSEPAIPLVIPENYCNVN